MQIKITRKIVFSLSLRLIFSHTNSIYKSVAMYSYDSFTPSYTNGWTTKGVPYRCCFIYRYSEQQSLSVLGHVYCSQHPLNAQSFHLHLQSTCDLCFSLSLLQFFSDITASPIFSSMWHVPEVWKIWLIVIAMNIVSENSQLWNSFVKSSKRSIQTNFVQQHNL